MSQPKIIITKNLKDSQISHFLHFALSQPVATVVIGCDNVEQIKENVKFVSRFKPMPEKQIRALMEQVKPFAHQLMYYKP